MTLHEAVAHKELAPEPEPLPAAVIDAHTHLDACGVETAEEVDAAMARAARVGVVAAVTVGGDMPSNRWSVAAAATRDDLFAAVAVHPTEALTLTDEARAELEVLAADPAVVAIGETGLDFYWDSAPHDVQAEAFAWHIDLAKRVGKPLMIHDRQAHDAIFDVLGAEGAPDTVIFHCFSGDEAMARICADHGYLMSFAGPVSFTNARDRARAAAVAPVDLIMVETDAPFLTPHPHRGRRNEPFALPYTVRALAQIRQMPLEELCNAVRINTERTYGISVTQS
jgi:TatD DNase family protein